MGYAGCFFGLQQQPGVLKALPKKDLLGFVDTRVGTAASIADITVTEVEEPMGYV